MTALFCDLVGFTPLSESLDPEEVRDIQAEYFSAMAEQIERYGGMVEKYAGDAVLALFGAAVAHEDDAERAVLCALGMQEAIEPVAATARQRWQVEPSIRVGVNTGEVVSGTWSASGRQDVAVTGDAVNTAARLQAVAEPGEVLVGTETMHLTRRRIHYGDRRDIVLKGKAGAVPVYPALGIREDFGERWEEREYVAPLIGRDRELVEFLDTWMRVQGGEGQLITLVGDAGVGKSRLISEVIDKIASNSAVKVVRGRCLSYGQEISLWLLADLLRSLFGIREQDGLEEVQPKLNAVLGGLLVRSDSETRAEARDVIGEVLGLPPGESVVANAGPQIRRQALIRSLRLLFQSLSERAPTMLVLEDMHWIDEASQEVLSEVLGDVPGRRLLVIAAHRPGRTVPWSEWGWPERLTLRPLRDQEAAVLAGAVLGGTTLSAELEKYVADRAGGNPFFVEEMLRALQETGGITQQDGQMALVPGAADRLPSTLTEVLLARLDRLDGQARNVAQVASVIGRSFAVRLLAEVVGSEPTALEVPLLALQRAEIAFPTQGIDPEYTFKHVSLREVAYNTLVLKRRQELHLQAARAIAALYPSDEYAEMIAYHYSRTDAPEAAEWLERAGDRAAAIYATDAAIKHYEDARSRLERSESESTGVAQLDEKLGVALSIAGRYDEAIEALERAADVYRHARDLESAGRVVARLGMAHRYRGTPEAGIPLVQPMIELLTWSGPSRALASLYLALATLYVLLGRSREQLEAAQRAGEIARAIGDDALLGEAEERRGLALTDLGRPEEGLRAIEGGIPLIEAGGDLVVLQRSLNNAGYAGYRLGRIEVLHGYIKRCVAVAERIGNPDQIAFSLSNYTDALLTLGRWDEAETQASRALGIVRSGRRVAGSVAPLLVNGQLALYRGRWREASELLQETLAMAEEFGDRQSQENSQTFLAELDILGGNPGEAILRLEPLAGRERVEIPVLSTLAWAYMERRDEDSIHRAQEMALKAVTRARDEGPFFLVDALRVQGMIMARQRRYEQSQRSFAESRELAGSMPVPYAEGRVLFEMSRMLSEQGEPEPARLRLQEALSIFQRLGAAKDVERTEQILASSV